jgi:hypothetical protein
VGQVDSVYCLWQWTHCLERDVASSMEEYWSAASRPGDQPIKTASPSRAVQRSSTRAIRTVGTTCSLEGKHALFGNYIFMHHIFMQLPVWERVPYTRFCKHFGVRPLMRRQPTLLFSRIPLILAAACLFAATAEAGPVKISFSGLVTNDPFGVFDSATFDGQYTFDSNATQVLNTVNTGGYSGSGGIFSIAVSFSGTVGGALDGIIFGGDTLSITVNNDFGGPLDQYLVTGTSSTDPNLTIELTLSDFTGTAFTNTLLPLVAPNLSSFSIAGFALFAGTVDNPIEAEGTLTSLVDGSAASVPEPTPLAFSGVGLILMACWFRRNPAP